MNERRRLRTKVRTCKVNEGGKILEKRSLILIQKECEIYLFSLSFSPFLSFLLFLFLPVLSRSVLRFDVYIILIPKPLIHLIQYTFVFFISYSLSLSPSLSLSILLYSEQNFLPRILFYSVPIPVVFQSERRKKSSENTFPPSRFMNILFQASEGRERKKREREKKKKEKKKEEDEEKEREKLWSIQTKR